MEWKCRYTEQMQAIEFEDGHQGWMLDDNFYVTADTRNQMMEEYNDASSIEWIEPNPQRLGNLYRLPEWMDRLSYIEVEKNDP